MEEYQPDAIQNDNEVWEEWILARSLKEVKQRKYIETQKRFKVADLMCKHFKENDITKPIFDGRRMANAEMERMSVEAEMAIQVEKGALYFYLSFQGD